MRYGPVMIGKFSVVSIEEKLSVAYLCAGEIIYSQFHNRPGYQSTLPQALDLNQPTCN